LSLVTAVSAIAADITPDEAAKHVGETVSVKGMVVEVFLSKGGNAYLNFGAAFPNQTLSADVLAKKREDGITPSPVQQVCADQDHIQGDFPR
jgi:hypothetical protein